MEGDRFPGGTHRTNPLVRSKTKFIVIAGGKPLHRQKGGQGTYKKQNEGGRWGINTRNHMKGRRWNNKTRAF